MRVVSAILLFILGWVACEAFRRLGSPPTAPSQTEVVEYQRPALEEKPRAIVAASHAVLPSGPDANASSINLPGGPTMGLKGRQALIHGLIGISPDRGEAGSASKMTATAVELDGSSYRSSVTFNQDVNDFMSSALSRVRTYMEIRHKGWPQNFNIMLSFEDKYSVREGASAAVACGLLLDSLTTGKENDPTFAVTGDLNADGNVQPISGVAAKIRGAADGTCRILAIPARNEKALSDILINDGPAFLAKVQIYSISTFDEAEALALKDKPAAIQKAISEMTSVQDVLLRDRAQITGWLRNGYVLGKLQAIQQLAPNNLSAKYLLICGANRMARNLTLVGSLEAVDDAASELISSIKTSRGRNASTIRKDVVRSGIVRLQTVRAKCDPQVLPYADAIIRFGIAVKEIQDRPPSSATRGNLMAAAITTAASSADAELNRLLNDPEIREEMER